MGAFNFNNLTNEQNIEKPSSFESNRKSPNLDTDINDDELLSDDEYDDDDVEYVPEEYIRYAGHKKPISLDEYPDSYIFRTGELARYLNDKEQNIRNIMNLYLDAFIKPESDGKGRMFTKEQMIKIEEIYNMRQSHGYSWPDIQRILSSELGPVQTAKDNLAAGEEMAELIKSWLKQTLENYSPAMALEDKEMLKEVTEKLNANEKALSELKESIKLQEAAMRNQAESFQEIIISQSRASKEQSVLLEQLKEQNIQLQEQNALLLEQTKPKKRKVFPFLK